MDDRVQSVERAFRLLELLAEADRGAGISDLAERSQLPVGTVHRLLNTLLRLGYADQDPETHKYTLGLRFMHLRGLVIQRLNLAQQAMPQMKALMHRVNETVHLAVLDEGEVVYIDRVEGLHTVGMYTQIGKRSFAHCTALGKVMLAHMPDSVWQQAVEKHGLYRRTPQTITTPEGLVKELERIRQRGFAIDDHESEQGIRCVAAPIRDYTGQVVAAVSISGPHTRIRPERDRELGELVCQTARQISASLGYLDADR
ncbi:MAG: IclR family transcriptional regulator [Chloroflexota bacterium]|jgi:DNA-binding IclR family transcriptional regulator